ncbi:MAG: c-type cytochrome [Thermoanaerobaculia bacterium]
MNRIISLRTATLAGLAAGVLGLALAAGVALAADTAPVYSTAVGKATYATYCASCHGIDLRGKGEIAATLSSKPTDLTRLEEKNKGVFPVERLTQVVDGRAEVAAHGTREMPVWGDLFVWPEGDSPERRAQVERKIGELLAYIRQSQAPAEKK